VLPGLARWLELEPAPASAPAWTLALALILAPLALALRFDARPRDMAWIVAAWLLSYAGVQLGSRVLELELNEAVGGFLVGAWANLYARTTRRPAAIVMVPGIILLVPGSIGFQSLFQLLQKDVLTGVETAARVGFVGISIVGGL